MGNKTVAKAAEESVMKKVYSAEFTRLLGVSGGFALVQKYEK